MTPMTHKERIDAVMNFKPTDRTPFALVDGAAWVVKHEDLTYNQLYHMPDGGAKILTEYYNRIDTDTVGGANGVFTACLNAFGCPIDIDHSGSPTNTGKCIEDPDTEIPALDKSTIREKLLANDFTVCMLNQCKHMAELNPDKYVHVDIAGPYTMACVMMGTAEYMLEMVMDEEKARMLLDFTTEVCKTVLTLLNENGANITFIAEPCSSGDMLSPEMFLDWVIPGLKEIKALPGYKYMITHICGGSGMRVIPLRDAGINAFSCDWAVDQEQALQDADGKLVIFGNINPAGNLLIGTAADTYDEAVEHIKVANKRGYIMAPGCDLGCDSPLENVDMLIKACKDHPFC